MNSAITSLVGMIERTPRFAGDPNAREMLRCVREGDGARGEQIARNLCDSYGVQPEQAVQMARQFFRL